MSLLEFPFLYKLGKKPARPNAVTFKLRDYVKMSALPKPPATFGHEGLVPASAWKMLGNDQVGNCVLAGGDHETMMLNREAARVVNFTSQTAIADYSALTGYDPSNPDTDQGTDMQAAASYRRKKGLLDAQGKRHTIAAYLAIDPGNLAEHFAAVWLFGCVGMGFEFPDSAMDQFNRGRVWDVSRGATIEGGHYVPLVAKRGNLSGVTWARLQQMTLRFFQRYNDESIAYVSAECLVNGKSPEGFNVAQLLDDLKNLKSAKSKRPSRSKKKLDKEMATC